RYFNCSVLLMNVIHAYATRRVDALGAVKLWITIRCCVASILYFEYTRGGLHPPVYEVRHKHLINKGKMQSAARGDI
ncbi:hypothetical protein, partial [Testudinibacter sp. TR-2022]|uniref:hypothetical protein n=1 Tax=Testudinibacter sp. TR-2022 TaxID=2585029 RepID=UPI002278FDB8